MTAEVLACDGTNDIRGSVVEGKEAHRLFMASCTAVEEGSALTEWAMTAATFEEAEEPEEGAKSGKPDQKRGGVLVGGDHESKEGRSGADEEEVEEGRDQESGDEGALVGHGTGSPLAGLFIALAALAVFVTLLGRGRRRRRRRFRRRRGSGDSSGGRCGWGRLHQADF